ncbi:hypothetical protein ACOMHN_063783 [Nucella lapillus]
MEVLTSNKGGMKLNHGDYLYTKHSTRKTSIWWKCVKRSSGNCRGSLKTDLQRLIPEVGQPHNHAPDQHQVRLAQVRMTMKRQAADTGDKPGQIYAQAASQCSDEVNTLMLSQCSDEVNTLMLSQCSDEVNTLMLSQCSDEVNTLMLSQCSDEVNTLMLSQCSDEVNTLMLSQCSDEVNTLMPSPASCALNGLFSGLDMSAL